MIIPGFLSRPFKYDYYRAVDFSLRWNYRAILPKIDSEINPSEGREISVEYGFNSDKIFKDFSFQAGTIQEIYNQYNYHKLIFHWREYISASSFIERSALSLGLQSSFIGRPVDDFLYNFAGGLPGIRGYSFYSIDGRKMVIGNAVYRFPVYSSIGRQLGFCYFDKLYASAGYYGGNAWDKGWIKINHLKHAVDFGLRLDMFSFYVYPTKIAFDAAYGFNDFPVFGKTEGKEWKFYCTMLFGYDF
jgi:outer membrane translocation and assembly module TamA